MNRTERDWEKVLWSNESPSALFVGDRRSNVHTKREKLHSNCVDKIVKHGGGKINVWGCFSANSADRLLELLV